jgi:hypothetical protein
MVRPTNKNFDLRKTRAAVEAGAFPKFPCRETSAVKSLSKSAERKVALSQHSQER